MAARSYVLPLAAVLGLAAGIGAGKLGGGPAASTAAPATAAAATKPPKSGKNGHAATEAKVSFVKPGPLPTSTDTVETLLALDRGPLYARLGLWLLDASEEDMTAFWEGYYQREDPNDTVKDLLFTQWSKKNAAGMLAVARRTGCEISAMWSWSMSDPQGMLAYVEGKDPSMRNYGLRGLAFFHPELARQMLEEDPALAGTFEMEQLAAMLFKGDAKAEMDFLGKYRKEEYYTAQSLKKWAEQDPHRAFEWLNSHGGEEYVHQLFLQGVVKEHPEALPELAATLPQGAMRRQFEMAAFTHLAETDPDKAREEALGIEVPRLAAERLAVLGKTLANEDPARALEVLADIYAKCPDVTRRMSWTRYPDGSGSGGSGVAGFHEFITTLTGKEPEQTMQALMDLEARNSPGGGREDSDRYHLGSYQVARTWAEKDLEGYAAWSQAQQAPEIRDMGASIASEQLRGRNDFSGAIVWAQRITDERSQSNAILHVVGSWVSRDRAAAQRWFEEAELPDQARKKLTHYFPAAPQE